MRSLRRTTASLSRNLFHSSPPSLGVPQSKAPSPTLLVPPIAWPTLLVQQQRWGSTSSHDGGRGGGRGDSRRHRGDHKDYHRSSKHRDEGKKSWRGGRGHSPHQHHTAEGGGDRAGFKRSGRSPAPTDIPPDSRVPRPTEIEPPTRTPRPTDIPPPSRVPSPTEIEPPSKTPSPIEDGDASWWRSPKGAAPTAAGARTGAALPSVSIPATSNTNPAEDPTATHMLDPMMDEIPIDGDVEGLPVAKLQGVLSAAQANVAELTVAVAEAEEALGRARQEVASELPLSHKRLHRTAPATHVALSTTEATEDPQLKNDPATSLLGHVPAATVVDTAPPPPEECVIAHAAHVASAVLVGAVVSTPAAVEGTNGAETILFLRVATPTTTTATSGSGTQSGALLYRVRCVGAVFGRYCNAVVRPGYLVHVVGTLRPSPVADAPLPCEATEEGDVACVGIEVVVSEVGGVMQVIYADAKPAAPAAADSAVA